MTGKFLEKYSLGVGDRFAHQAKPQLAACILAARQGVTIVPVWNKSNREHKIVGSEPSGTRAAADLAVRELDWNCSYYLDADHINLGTVDRFLAPCDFFTLDVADTIGTAPAPGAVDDFVRRHPELIGRIGIPGIPEPLAMSSAQAQAAAHKYLAAVADAARIYRHIAGRKDPGQFVTEVSMDETDCPQTPPELLLILAAIADAGIPIQTIAPKFTGRFNKGVDYVGDVIQFEKEFLSDIAVIAHAVRPVSYTHLRNHENELLAGFGNAVGHGRRGASQHKRALVGAAASAGGHEHNGVPGAGHPAGGKEDRAEKAAQAR